MSKRKERKKDFVGGQSPIYVRFAIVRLTDIHRYLRFSDDSATAGRCRHKGGYTLSRPVIGKGGWVPITSVFLCSIYDEPVKHKV